MPDSERRRPAWLKILVTAMALPLLAMPALISMMPDHGANMTLLKLYPLYVLASCWCMIMCYPARRDMLWILAALGIMSHASIWYLAFAA